MALENCKECGHPISKSASACPSCGAKIKRTTLLTKIFAVFIGLVALGMIFSAAEKDKDDKEMAKKQVAEQAKLAALPPEQRAIEEKRIADEKAHQEEVIAQGQGLRWVYDFSDDKMGRGKIRNAFVRSLNEITFGFPYQGAQRAGFGFRSHPEYGKDVMLSVERGQFLCGIDGTEVTIKFDEGKPQKFSASEPSDSSTTLLFIHGFNRILTNTKKAKKVYIEAEFYQEGKRVFEFNVSDLKW